MATTVELEILTPERALLKDEVEMVIVPAIDGELGVLPGHFPLITGLKIGVMRIRKPKSEEWTPIAISGGFMEVLPHRVQVLVPTAELPEEIDVERAEAALQRAEQRLHEEDIDKTRAEAALQRALARIKAARYGE